MRLKLAQVTLRLDGGSATGARRSHRLFVDAIGHVARDENAGMFALGQMPGEQVTIRIRLEFPWQTLSCSDHDRSQRKRRPHEQIRSSCVCTLRKLHRSHLALFIRNVFVTTVFQIGSIFSCASTRSAMILEARNLSRR